MAQRKALLIGINYPGTAYALQGCWNDTELHKGYLKSLYGYADADITIITDSPGSAVKPTGKVIRVSCVTCLCDMGVSVKLQVVPHIPAQSAAVRHGPSPQVAGHSMRVMPSPGELLLPPGCVPACLPA